MKKGILSTLALTGLAASLSAQTVKSGNITQDETWSGEIVMDGAIFVKDGATLTINAGTIVRGQPRTAAVQANVTTGTPGVLVVTQTGRIVANGNASNPIIFTTAAVDNDNNGVPDDADTSGFLDAWTAGDTFYDDDPKNAPLAPLNKDGFANVSLWGGLIVLGNAPTNLSNKDGVGYGKGMIEGLTVPGFPSSDATYGGLLPHDNSGSLKFVSVRHAGDEIGADNELNGISLGGVGDGTTFENIEVYCNFDDGIEWFGGTLNGKNLAVFFVGDDSFDLDEGYTGTNQFVFAVMPFFNQNDGTNYGSKSGDKAGEFDGLNGDDFNTRVKFDITAFDATPWPLPNPEFWNTTLIGSSLAASPEFTPVSVASANTGFNFIAGYAGSMYSAFIINTGSAGGIVVSTDTQGGTGFTVSNNVANGLVNVISSTFNNTAALSGDAATVLVNGDAIADEFGGTANVVNAGNNLTQGDISFDPTGDVNGKLVSSLKAAPIDPRPAFAFSGVIGGAQAQGLGLEGVPFRGAFSRTAPTLWTTGWTAMNIAGLLAD